MKVKILLLAFYISSCNYNDYVDCSISDLELEKMNEDVSRYYHIDSDYVNLLNVDTLNSMLFHLENDKPSFMWMKCEIIKSDNAPLKINNYSTINQFNYDWKHVQQVQTENVIITTIYHMQGDLIYLNLMDKGGILLEDTIIYRTW